MPVGIFKIKDKDGDVEFQLTEEGYPSCCGAGILHDFKECTYKDTLGGKARTDYFKRISKKFTSFLLCTDPKQKTDEVRVIYRESLPVEYWADKREYKEVDRTADWIDMYLEVATLLVMDAEWGEDLGEHQLSLYSLCYYDDRWVRGELTKNPNSENKVMCFELNKEYDND